MIMPIHYHPAREARLGAERGATEDQEILQNDLDSLSVLLAFEISPRKMQGDALEQSGKYRVFL